MSQSLVSVVVPVYNGAKYLEKTVETILNQDYQYLELILVDDGSKDDSKAVIEKIAESDGRVKGFSKENGGVANARNFAISKAQGEFIAFCDQDDFWLPSKLSKQVPLFHNEKVGLVYTGAIAEYTLYNKQSKPSFDKNYRGKVFDKIVEQNMFTCCTAMARKSVIEKVGGFDDDRALMGVDDWHLWLKLAMVCEFDFIPEHLAIHVFHGDNYSLNDQKMHEAELVCLDKIEQIAKDKSVSANWDKIKLDLHVRYAHSYIFSGFFKLAGDTFFRAAKIQPSLSLKLKGCLFKFVPSPVWRLMQSAKRAFA